MEKQLVATAFGALLTTSVAWAGPNYTYLQAGYVNQDVDVGNAEESVDGFKLEGSFDMNNSLYVTASLGDQSGKVGGSKLEYDTQSIGIGGHRANSEQTDIFFEVSLVDIDVNVGNGPDQGEMGFSAGIGLKSLVQRKLEVEAQFAYVDVVDDGDIGFEVLGVYHIQNGLAAGAGYNYLDGDSGMQLFARFYFQ